MTQSGIILEALEKTYKSPAGPVHAVRGVDIAIAPGETVALLGPNGAGKSTTIDMLLGLQRPDKGTVTVFGRPPQEAVAAGAVGVVLPISGPLRPLSVRGAVTMMGLLFPN